MKKITLLLCFTLLTGCESGKFADITDIEIKGTGHEGEKAGKLCSMFKLNQDQVKTYFKKAKEIDSNEAHHEHDYYSCWVHGGLKYQGANCTWSIDIGGLANVQCNSKEYVTYCKSCESFMLDQIP